MAPAIPSYARTCRTRNIGLRCRRANEPDRSDLSHMLSETHAMNGTAKPQRVPEVGNVGVVPRPRSGPS